MTNIVYLPETIAERPSALREQVYQDRHPMPSPTLDPSGWKLLPPVEAVGTLVKNATVTAQLAIANPVRPGYFYLISVNFSLFWDSCHLRLAHRYHYSLIYATTRVPTSPSTRSTSVLSVHLLHVVSPEASASLTSHVPCSGRFKAPLLAG